MANILILYPAYGRVYSSVEKLQEAYHSGKDFSCTLYGGPYATESEVKDFDGVRLVQLEKPVLVSTILFPKD